MRRTMAAVVASAWVSLSCGDDRAPCTECPDLSGPWALSYGQGIVPSACTAQGVGLPDGPLVIVQEGPRLSGQLEQAALRGTLYDTHELSLVGAAGAEQLHLRARYVRPLPSEDGGTPRLTGSLTVSVTESADGGCSFVRELDAVRY